MCWRQLVPFWQMTERDQLESILKRMHAATEHTSDNAAANATDNRH